MDFNEMSNVGLTVGLALLAVASMLPAGLRRRKKLRYGIVLLGVLFLLADLVWLSWWTWFRN